MADITHDIHLFISIAKIEAALAADRTLLQRLPQDIAAIEKAVADIDAIEKKAHDDLEEMKKKRRDVEKKLREHEDHLKKSRGQQSLVKTNEEYTAMLKEISNLEAAISDEEETLLILMDGIESAEKDTTAKAAVFKTEREAKLAEKKRLEGEMTRVQAESQKLAAQKPKILAEISPAYRKTLRATRAAPGYRGDARRRRSLRAAAASRFRPSSRSKCARTTRSSPAQRAVASWFIMKIDRALATKLAAVLKLVMHGKALPVAVAEAGISKSEMERVVKELERALWTRARALDEDDVPEVDPHAYATAPAKPASRKKAAARAASTSKAKTAKSGLALIAYADGGARGNPGEAACASLITNAKGEELLRRARRLGKTTNNVAEYEGVLLALDLCKELGAAKVTLRLDSELVVRQIEGRYKVKHPDLMQLHHRVMLRKRTFEDLHVEHIPRKENTAADAMVNAALDGKELD
jgi:ribonuclease HI/predicted  nucleic acid-binding Zn-ribbon protein